MTWQRRWLTRLVGTARMRAWLVRRYQADLRRFLAHPHEISFGETTAAPLLSVIIPVYNSAFHTLRCLQSLSRDQSVTLEVIVFDNASSDETATVLAHCPQVKVIRCAENLGFIGAVNAAAMAATGRFLLLLNNDATLAAGTLRDAIAVFTTTPRAGAVGARIRFATGQAQEAGSIIFRDGSTDGYLRNQDASDPRALFQREVDYCSGVFLLVERQQFEALGGLDEAFAPAYFEETDLCMRLRQAGRRVIYTPQVVIEHFEFGSQPTARAWAAIAERRPIFIAKWQETLDREAYCPPTTPPDVAMRRLIAPPRFLILWDEQWSGTPPPALAALLAAAGDHQGHLAVWAAGLKPALAEHLAVETRYRCEFIFGAATPAFLNHPEPAFDLIAALGPAAQARLENLRHALPPGLAGAAVITDATPETLVKILENHQAACSKAG
jgi:GT2 family glycosyltransferase